MSKSYEKINYVFRLKKQIERKMIIETLQQISILIDISKYHYFGFGSVYFADFLLFHKYLNINSMTSIDHNKDDEKRFTFNKPYGFITFKISDSTTFMERELKWEDKLFIWLDYDGNLDMTMIDDAKLVASKSKPLDIYLVTMRATSPPNIDDFKEEFALYIPRKLKYKDFKGKEFPKVLNGIMTASIESGLNTQENIRFLQLFNITYSDASKMYTFGGIFYKDNKCADLKDRLSNLHYISHDDRVVDIDCPILTLKEKITLDSCIKAEKCELTRDELGLRDKDIESYGSYYKYYPQFFESVY